MSGPAQSLATAATPLPQLVKQTRDRLLTLVRQADPASAEWIDAIRSQRPATPSVVVIGETNRGKSSLVNALLDYPGLSPVDTDVSTATYLRFEYGSQWAAHACYPGQEPVSFDLARLADWVSALGELPAGQLRPRYVRVTAPVEELSRVTVVDTPGVGGLDSMHGELAMEAATAATALLFVIDASAPFTRGELDFLHEVGDRVETVVFALTKTDQHRGWRRILEEDRRLLAQHAPRFAELAIHPVSPRMHELAMKATDERSGSMLRERAGIEPLRSELQRLVAGRGAMLGEANTMRALATALGELVAKFDGETRALTAGEDEVASLRSRRKELSTARRSSTRGWVVKLRGEIQRTRVEAGHDVTRQMRDVQNWCRRAIDTADRKQLAELPHQVDAALQMVSTRVAASLSRRIVTVTETVLSDLFSPAELDVIRAQFAKGAYTPVALRPPERRPPTAEDKLLIFMGVSGGLGVGRAAAMPLAGLGVAALNPIVLPVTIVLGLGAGWWMARTRKHTADKQHMKQWLTEAIAEARSTLDQLVAEQLIGAEQQLSLALDEALSRRIESIDGELQDIDKALKMDAAERAQELNTAQQRLVEARSGRDKAEQLLHNIRDLRDRNA